MRKNLEKLIYKLSVDTLSLSLFAYLLVLIVDGIAPGYVSSHLSFTKMTAVIVLLILTIVFLARRNEISYSQKIFRPLSKNKTTIFLAVTGSALIFNSLHKLGRFEIIVTAGAAIFILYFFFQVLFSSPKD